MTDPKRPRAVALQYTGEGAPKVTAKGEGQVAKTIISEARAAGVPIEENEALIEALAKVKLQQEIPPKLYVAIAQILAYIYYLDGRKPGQPKRS